MGKHEGFKIIIIEDDQSEQKLLNILIKASGYNCSIEFLSDGEQAINYINTTVPEKPQTLPGLILLDLNLPRVHGIEILKAIKNNNILRSVPVVILSTSNNINDVRAAYQHYASGFIRKPSDFEDYQYSIKIILQYWINVCISEQNL